MAACGGEAQGPAACAGTRGDVRHGDPRIGGGEALKSVKQAGEESSALRAWKREVSTRRLERGLLDKEFSYDDSFEYETARDLAESYAEDFPAWMGQSVAESGFEPNIL